jgi:hypothetical protein
MFACPQPEDGPTIDGCPIVNLPESSKDVHNLVKLLYDPIKTYIQDKPVSASLLKTMLHFGRKYEMKTLRREAVSCLLSEFPSDLDEWTDETPFAVDIYQSPTSLFKLLSLAHEHCITSILPALYLRICLLHDLEDITKGFQHVSEDPLMANKLFINCLSGRESLHRSVSSLTLAWLRDENKECKIPKQCWKEKTKLITSLWNTGVDDSLEYAMASWKRHEIFEGLCSSCLEAGRVAYSHARIINWDELKTIFGLDDLEAGSEASSDTTDSDSDGSASTESD